MNITKVIFTPKRLAPAKCKRAEYFIDTVNWGEAIARASVRFKNNNVLYHYYMDAIATTVKVYGD